MDPSDESNTPKPAPEPEPTPDQPAQPSPQKRRSSPESPLSLEDLQELISQGREPTKVTFHARRPGSGPQQKDQTPTPPESPPGSSETSEKTDVEK